jgi:hypothetical protein
LYEEVEPARILDERAAATGSGKEYLVQYKVGGAVLPPEVLRMRMWEVLV